MTVSCLHCCPPMTAEQTDFLERHKLISYLFDLYHSTGSRVLLHLLLGMIGAAEKAESGRGL